MRARHSKSLMQCLVYGVAFQGDPLVMKNWCLSNYIYLMKRVSVRLCNLILDIIMILLVERSDLLSTVPTATPNINLLI